MVVSSSSLQTSQARRSTLIRFNPRERWSVGGKTGTGKTVFERWWLAHWYAARWPIVIIDIKRKFASRFATEPELATVTQPFSIDTTGQLVEGCPVMIYHPSLPGWSDPKLERLLLEILAHGQIVLAIDEANGVTDQSHSPLGLKLIYTQGRESDIPTLTCWQTPVRIDVNIIEQAEWHVVFRINNPDYRKKLVEITGFPELERRPQKFFYWLANESWDEPVLMAPIPEAEVLSSGSKDMGTSGGRLLDTAHPGGRQGRGQIPTPRVERQTGAREVRGHADASHSRSRLHAHAGRRQANQV